MGSDRAASRSRLRAGLCTSKTCRFQSRAKHSALQYREPVISVQPFFSHVEHLRSVSCPHKQHTDVLAPGVVALGITKAVLCMPFCSAQLSAEEGVTQSGESTEMSPPLSATQPDRPMSRKQKGVLATVKEEEDVPKASTVSYVPFAQKSVGLHLLAVLRKVPGGRSANVEEQVHAMSVLAHRICDDGMVQEDHETGSVIVWFRVPDAGDRAPVFMDAHLDTVWDLPKGEVPEPVIDGNNHIQSPWLDNRIGCALLLHVGAMYFDYALDAKRDLALIFSGNEEHAQIDQPHAAAVIARRNKWAEGAVFDVSPGEDQTPKTAARRIEDDMTQAGPSHASRAAPEIVPKRLMDALLGWGPIIQRHDARPPLAVWTDEPPVTSWQQSAKPPDAVRYPNNVRDYALGGVPSIRYLSVGVAGAMHGANSRAHIGDIEQAAYIMMQWAREMTSAE